MSRKDNYIAIALFLKEIIKCIYMFPIKFKLYTAAWKFFPLKIFLSSKNLVNWKMQKSPYIGMIEQVRNKTNAVFPDLVQRTYLDTPSCKSCFVSFCFRREFSLWHQILTYQHFQFLLLQISCFFTVDTWPWI